MIPEYLAPLANHLWQSSLFAVIAILVAMALKRNRASVRYWLFLAASLKFLIPFSLLVNIGSQLEWRPGWSTVEPPLVSVMGEIRRPFVLPASTASGGSARSARPAGTTGDVPTLPAGRIPALLFSVWLCGFAAGAFSWFREWRRMRAIVGAASPLQLNLPIRAVSAPALIEPGVFGIVDPILLLPRGITARLTPAQLEAILAHELCHVRRRDNLTATIHLVVESIFWFHPLVWWIGIRLMDERERACDEEALRVIGDPHTYAEGILNVCRFYKVSPSLCVSGVTGSNLRKRIEAIMTQDRVRRLGFMRAVLLAAAGIAAVAGPVSFGLLTASQSEARPQSGTTTAVEPDLPQIEKSPESAPADVPAVARTTARRKAAPPAPQKPVAEVFEAPVEPPFADTLTWRMALPAPPPGPAGPFLALAERGIRVVRPGEIATPEDIVRLQTALGQRVVVEVMQAPDGTVQRMTIRARRSNEYDDEYDFVTFDAPFSASHSVATGPADGID